MRKLSAVLVVILVLVAVAATGEPMMLVTGYVPGQVEEAYAYTHGGYVGRAVVRVQSDGSLDVDIDEAFLPHTLGIVDIESAEWTDENTAYYIQRGSEVRVAKYIEYDGTVYVGTTVGGAMIYVEADENGMPAGSQDLEQQILRNQSTMAAYYNGIQSGSFKIYTRFGGRAMTVSTTSYGGVTKNNSPGYWAFGQTWQGNIDAIEEFIEENGSDYSASDMVRASEENADGLRLWSVADAVTGATNSDFKDYFAVAQLAIAQLKTR